MDNLPALPASSAALTVRDYIQSSLAPSTLKAYKTDLEHFTAWGAAIPCSPEAVATYLSSYATSLSMATLGRRIVAISKAHTARSLPDPTKTDVVRLTFRGIKRLHGRPQAQVSPVMKDDLIVMLSHTPDNLKGCRDRTLLLLGFCAALRRSELVAVRAEDLEFNSQGVILTLPRSKTDQAGQGRKIGIPKARGRVCPVASVAVWLEQSGIQNGCLFRAVSKGGVLSEGGLSDRSVADIIKHYAAKAGLDPDRYGGHSLRAGLATSAAQAGISSWKIRAQTGHRSENMLARYIRDGDLFSDNAAALF